MEQAVIYYSGNSSVYQFNSYYNFKIRKKFDYFRITICIKPATLK
jgi:hypothetical protein